MGPTWRTWLIFVGGLLIVLAALGWMTVRTLDSGARAIYEESVRLALWRLESSVSPMILQESARPHSVYGAHGSPGAWSAGTAVDLTPSPLLTEKIEHTLLHFEITDNGIRSPQVPIGAFRKRVTDRGLPETTLAESVEHLTSLKNLLSIQEFDACVTAVSCESPAAPETRQSVQVELPGQMAQIIDNRRYQSFRNSEELKARKKSKRRAERQNSNPQLETSLSVLGGDSNLDSELSELTGRDRLLVSGMQALWFKGELFVARRVRVGSNASVQACWIDWKSLKDSILAEVRDLFPAADLVPAETSTTVESSRRLASLPALLVPGALAEAVQTTPPETWLPLALAWFCVAVFAIATGFLLNGAVSLSERRGAFVSAVTHELRTPLTTFQMYTEMLSSGMVHDEEKRQRYLATLSTEADRLGHMVENVLAYARLENRGSTRRLDEMGAGDVVDHVQERLTEKARQGGLRLSVRASDLADARVRVHLSTVEQILLNLVDNACKYAACSTSEPLVLTAQATSGHLSIALRDAGPGIAGEDLGRLFRPFSKSAREAANSAPGIGLGLALSRRLARDLGGDLAHVASDGEPGACFELRLPLV